MTQTDDSSFVITSDELEDLVNGSYESEAYCFPVSEDTERGSVFHCGRFYKDHPVDYYVIKYDNPGDEVVYYDWRDLLKHNKCPKYITTALIQDLVNAEALPEGRIIVQVT